MLLRHIIHCIVTIMGEVCKVNFTFVYRARLAPLISAEVLVKTKLRDIPFGCRAVGWGGGGCVGCARTPPPPPLGQRRSARPTSRPRSAHRLVKSRILSGSSSLFSPNSLKSPLNWLKCTQKILGQAPETPCALPFLHILDPPLILQPLVGGTVTVLIH